MFNHRLTLILSLCWVITACADAPPPSLSIQVVIDNSAVLAQPEQALAQQKRLLFELTQLRKRHDSRHADIQIVSTNYPRNLWVGTPQRLRMEGKTVLEQVAMVENGCSDLRGAFDQVRMNLRRQPAQEVRVFVFASLIDTGAPCGGETVIRLPQAPPAGLDLAFLDERVSTLKFYWAHPLQVKPWFDLLEGQGLTQRANTDPFDLGVYDENETPMQLEKGL